MNQPKNKPQLKVPTPSPAFLEAVTNSLERLVAQGKIEVRLNEKGEPIYGLAKHFKH